jgi:hypothetical protein
LSIERRLDFRQAAGKEDRCAGKGLRQGRPQGIAHHRMVVGDQEGTLRSRRVGHFRRFPSTKV